MVRAYSLDLRERVVAAVTAGETCRAVAARFGVSVASVVKWSQRARRTGSVAPDKFGRPRPFVLEPHRDWVLGRIADKPDLTIQALVDELADQGVKASRFAVWNFLRREAISFKKKPARGRAGPAGRGASPSPLEAPSRQA
jgi:transposase